MDIVIRQGLVFGLGEVLDIGIEDGKIVRLAPALREKGRAEIDAVGCVVSPGFIDPHVHMDKCLTLQRIGPTRSLDTLESWIAAQREVKRSFTSGDVRDRALHAAKLAAACGTTTTRTCVEADPILEYRAVDGILAAKEACRVLIDIETVAFPQEGWLASADGSELESRPYMHGAMERGIEVVGGNVNRMRWHSEPEAQVDELFDLAQHHDAGIDIHLDNADDAAAFTLPYVARKTIEQGFHGRVTVAHIASLAQVPDRTAYDTIDLVKEAQLSVVVLPTRIRLTRVLELLEAGVNVAIGTDNLQDAFCHIGCGADMLQAVLLLAQVLNLGDEKELETLFRMATFNASKTLCLEADYGVREGYRADLIVLEAPSAADAIRYAAGRRTVIKAGKVVARHGRLVGSPHQPQVDRRP